MAGLKFRVLLDTTDNQEIFRDILMDENDHFESFYRAILSAYSFSGDQMASFYMSNENWDRGFEISLFDMSFGEDPDQIMPAVMSESRIADYIQDDEQKMILVHDFMRMWIFLIELIGTTANSPAHPEVLLSVGKAPAEDSRSAEGGDLNFATDVETDFDEGDDEFGFGEFEEGFEGFDDFDDY